MKTSPLSLSLFLTAAIIGSVNTTTRAADPIDNPKYTAWSQFKTGSTATLVADSNVMGQIVHIEMVRSLASITPESAVIEISMKVSLMGQDKIQPAQKETIPSKSGLENEQVVAQQDQDVQAMGKTYKCKVYTITSNKAASQPTAAGSDAKPHATIYMNSDVPGGIVKMETAGSSRQLNFLLSAMDAK